MARVSVLEMQTVGMIARMQDEAKPPCPGPVVVHRDGVFECHGGCSGVSTAFHDSDSIWPCDSAMTRFGLKRANGGQSLDELATSCNRCRNHR